MRAGLLLLGGLLLAQPAQAALPPAYQRIVELRAVLDDAGVSQALEGREIDSIRYLAPDRYEVSAQGCHLGVAIIGLPMPPNLVGPRPFKVQHGPLICPEAKPPGGKSPN